MTIRLLRCPRCRSFEICWREYTEVFSDFIQDKSGVAKEGYHSEGNILRVEGHCLECPHIWRARGISTLSGIPGFWHDPDLT